MGDIRAQYWLEATEHIRQANKRPLEDERFWASTLSALVNATMASASDATIEEVDRIMIDKSKRAANIQEAIQQHISEELNEQ